MMADFVQMMKDWRRMCKFCSDKGMADGRHGCVDECPLGHNAACGDIETATDRDIEEMARAISQWAAEHPEPVYPTWYEWLTSIGAVTRKVKPDVASALIETGLLDPIPADIADNLGIEPKEG